MNQENGLVRGKKQANVEMLAWGLDSVLTSAVWAKNENMRWLIGADDAQYSLLKEKN